MKKSNGFTGLMSTASSMSTSSASTRPASVTRAMWLPDGSCCHRISGEGGGSPPGALGDGAVMWRPYVSIAQIAHVVRVLRGELDGVGELAAERGGRGLVQSIAFVEEQERRDALRADLREDFARHVELRSKRGFARVDHVEEERCLERF